MKPDNQERVDSIEWYPEIDFGNGVRSKSREPSIEYLLQLWSFIETTIADVDFADKTVLDVGCWDGRWSFYAERRGARAVLACDDSSQNWGSGKGIRLGKELLNSRIDIMQSMSVYEIASLNRTFDVIFFMGVYYHLLHPLLALTQIRHCCHPQSVVIVEGDVVHALLGKLAYVNLPDPHGSIFIPTPEILRDMLESAYFRVNSEHYLYGESQAERSANLLSFAKSCEEGSDTKEFIRQCRDRAVMVCQPFVGQNDTHMYRPPFGLAKYDPRFRNDTANPR